MMNRTLRTLAVLSLVAAAGCQDSASGPSSMEQRQDAALKDPFGYGPSTATPGAPPRPGQLPTDAGGFNKRDDSLRGDWNNFWNP